MKKKTKKSLVHKVYYLDVTQHSGWNNIKDIEPEEVYTYGEIIGIKHFKDIEFYIVEQSKSSDDGGYELVPVSIVTKIKKAKI